MITGEGSLDEQTLHGKAPAGVAAAGRPASRWSRSRPARSTPNAARRRHRRGYALTDIEPDVQRCMAEAGPLLERLARTLADERLS